MCSTHHSSESSITILGQHIGDRGWNVWLGGKDGKLLLVWGLLTSWFCRITCKLLVPRPSPQPWASKWLTYHVCTKPAVTLAHPCCWLTRLLGWLSGVKKQRNSLKWSQWVACAHEEREPIMTGRPTGRCGARSSVTPTLHEGLVMRNYNSRTGRQVYKEPAHVPFAVGGPDRFSSAICSPTISLLSHLGTFWFTDPWILPSR